MLLTSVHQLLPSANQKPILCPLLSYKYVLSLLSSARHSMPHQEFPGEMHKGSQV
jgi:hypothetical protein